MLGGDAPLSTVTGGALLQLPSRFSFIRFIHEVTSCTVQLVDLSCDENWLAASAFTCYIRHYDRIVHIVSLKSAVMGLEFTQGPGPYSLDIACNTMHQISLAQVRQQL